jgi:3-hydroxymyristoyl/3-hydroxydecanoyl-(acyl carrier protein) dehydratase
MKTERFRVPPEHPVFAGHFPDAPLVPGSMLLDLVLRAWGMPVARVPEVKFLKPVLPGETVVVHFTAAERGGGLRFACEVEGQPVCSGILLSTDYGT